MNLSTTYLGMDLPHPLMVGASPLVDKLDTVKRLEEAGAAAVVMHSLFEEQIIRDQMNAYQSMESHTNEFAEALSYLPDPEEFRLGPDEYLDQIRKLKESVHIPVIASLNGVSLGGWTKYARLIEQAGADALELNVYDLATDPEVTGQSVEQGTLDLVKEVRQSVRIPLAVKLSPFYSSIGHFARCLDEAGADGLVLFNRFYQPDFDLEEMSVKRINLSSSTELLLRLRWVGILSGQVKASLSVTGGVHTGLDAVKAVMAGAHAVQVVSAVLTNGPGYLTKVLEEMKHWMTEHEYESVAQMTGCMSLRRCPEPGAYERANYIQMLNSWPG